MKYVGFFFLFLSMACTMETVPPEFKDLRIVGISKMTGSEVSVEAAARFYNPNKANFKLKSVNIDVLLDGKKVGHIDEVKNIKIHGERDFVVPMDVQINLKESGMINNLLGMISGKRMQAEFVGYVKLGKGGLSIKVPIHEKEMINLKL